MRVLVGRALLEEYGRPDLAPAALGVIPDIYESPMADRDAPLRNLPLIVKSHAAELSTESAVVSLHRSPADALASFWRFALDRNYKERNRDPDEFAMANLSRWVDTAEAQLERVRATQRATLVLYADLCEDPHRELRAALAGWGLRVSSSAVQASVDASPPSHLEHGYASSVLSRRILRRIERATRPLWDELQRAGRERVG